MGVVSVNTKELEALCKKLEGFDSDKKDQFLEAAAKDLAARFIVIVKRATPKDTGTLRRGWTGGKDTSETACASASPVRRNGQTYTITVENNVEYASYVEYGHRTRGSGYVKPQYYVKRSEQAFEPHVPRFLQKKLDQFMKETFNG